MNTKILIVDDRPENIKSIQAVLDELDIEIDTATSGNDALALVMENDYALVLLDVQMPEMDGFEVAEIMRSHNASKYTPIIFVTAISKEENYVFKGYETGAVDYLHKPFQPTILLYKVKIFIALHQKEQRLIQAYADLETANQKILQQQEERLKSERLTLLAEISIARVAELNRPIKALASYLQLTKQQANNSTLLSENLHKAELIIKEISNRVKMLALFDINQLSNQVIQSPEFIENIQLKLLVLEPNKQEQQRLSQLTSAFSEINIDYCKQVSDALEKINTVHYDLIISEFELADANAIDLLEKLRQLGQSTLVVILTQQTSATLAAKVMKAGAYDYIDKTELTGETLSALLIACYSALCMQKEVYKTREQINNRSSHDSLTGLLQREVLNETLPRLINESYATGSNIVVAMIDLDHFKQTNDTYGHTTGDYVLKKLAELMMTSFRSNDLIFRYGGEEFLVVMPETSLSQAINAAERFRQTVAEVNFAYQQQYFNKTLSIGMASWLESDKPSMTDFINCADKKLYQAKQQGRNRVLA